MSFRYQCFNGATAPNLFRPSYAIDDAFSEQKKTNMLQRVLKHHTSNIMMQCTSGANYTWRWNGMDVIHPQNEITPNRQVMILPCLQNISLNLSTHAIKHRAG